MIHLASQALSLLLLLPVMLGIREHLGAPKAGDWLGIIKFDALAGRFWKVDKDAAGQPALTDLIGKPIAVDLATAQVGWMKFGPTGPIRHMAAMGCPPVPMPDEADASGKPTFKAGFYMRACGQALDGIREWTSTTAVLLDTFDILWAQYQAAPEALAGQIPLIVMTGATPLTRGSGARRQTTYTPIIQITGWVDRPESLGHRTVILSPKPTTNGAPVAALQQVAALIAAPAPQPLPVQQPVAAATNLPVDQMPF